MQTNSTSRYDGTSRPRAFLETVARAYYDNFDDLSEFCFVFPNKRAGAFFIKHLHKCADSVTLMAPYVTSITDFVARLADRDVASRVDLLFRLYNIYRQTRGLSAGEDVGKVFSDFDSFRNWGEVLLSDFSEVDQYNVDADALFQNVADWREISSDFLTDEQKEVMERYFGYTPAIAEVQGFWKNMAPPSDIKNKFRLLWQQMAPLYHALEESLEAERLTTSGGAYRRALENLDEKGREILPWKKVVMVGFNALSTTEALIFETLRRIPPEPGVAGQYAEFYWDGTGPVLSQSLNDSSTFLKYNRRNFPSPSWAANAMAAGDVAGMPEDLVAVASPSNSAQGKIAGAKIETLVDKLGPEDFKDARVAVVLPDENLLMPLLYSLPGKTGAVNLTMGYPLRTTSVMSFIYHLRRLRAACRKVNGESAWYHEDLRLFLAHPYSHALIGSRKVSEINGFLNRHHKIVLTRSELMAISPEAADALRDLDGTDVTSDAIDYLDEVLTRVSAALESRNEGVLKSRIDRSHIEVYRDALRRLRHACDEHDIRMGVEGVFSMADKLLAGEQVTFEGEPLEGLQVMGLLETRALDFDHLVILSMNDKIMPRKASGRTFIPDSLRHGYGLPYSNYREDLFSYYFYRMISRARSVTMIYDARAGEGMRSGGISRYLMQLKYLYAPEILRFENCKYMLSSGISRPRAVEKTAAVNARLEEYLIPGSGSNLSASALRNYFTCPVKFYYENVAGVSTDVEVSEYIDAITQGNVIHDVMLRLYFPEDRRKIYLSEPILMTREKIRSIADDRGRITRLVTQSINRYHFNNMEFPDRPLDGAAEIVASHIVGQIKTILDYDQRLTPFRLVGGEISGLVEWPFGADGRKVNMKYAIDRLDFIGEPESGYYRIVDYKTGAAHVKAKEFDSIFNGDEDAKNFFQLMLYANLMNRDRGSDEEIRLAIYEIGSLLSGGETLPQLKMEVPAAKGKVKSAYCVLPSQRMINDAFLERTDAELSRIFNPDEPFRPTEEESNCRYCQLSHLCGKNLR